MSVIIRLQNLPLLANAHDIRLYFAGLSIPEGGVHIVGGEKGDAFIAFSTDEDARRAFNRNNGKIKDAPITLLLSSRSEMQKVIESARKHSMAAFMSASQPPMPILPSVVPSTAGAVADKRHSAKGDARRPRSRSRSRDRFDRHSSSYERHRRRSRSRSRSRSRERKFAKSTIAASPHRVDVWAAQPTNANAAPANTTDPANLLASLVANNLMPNILSGNNTISQLAAVLQEHLQKTTIANNAPIHPQNSGTSRDSSRFNNCAPNAPNNCVKLFPCFGSMPDVAEFFKGTHIANSGIIFSTDSFGNRNGQVLVNFEYPEGKIEAIGRSGERLRNQTVNIEHVPDAEFLDAFAAPAPFNQRANHARNRLSNPNNGFNHLKIEMLPNFVNLHDVRTIFRSFRVIAVAIEPRGRFKSAYVRFANPRDAEDALADRTKHMFEGKPINVQIASEQDFEMVAHEFGADTTPHQAQGLAVITLSGLPPKCNDRDVADFFSDVGVMPSKINMIPNSSGFCDEAVCEFYNVDDAVQAYQKNGTLFGNSRVSMRFDGSPMNRAMIPSLMNVPNATTNGKQSFFQNRNANQFNGPMMRGARSMQHVSPSPQMRFFENSRRRQQQHDLGDDDAMAPPGCVLLMENVPYKAGIEEITHFFGGFQIPCDSVLRKYNANGLPAGEAKIIFNNPEEAYRVLQQCRGRKMRDRVIHLIQV